MAVTATRSVSQIVTAALRKAHIVSVRESADAAMAAECMEELNRMLKGWQTAMPYMLFTQSIGSLTLTNGTYIYALSSNSVRRPLKILSARFKDSTETPMLELTRDEYDELPNKTADGIPTNFYYDRQREEANFYIWPSLATVTTQTIEYTYEREVEDITALTDTVDVPSEWWDAVVYNLAARMVDTFPVHPDPNAIRQRAESLRRQTAASEHVGKVRFGRV